MGPLERPLTVTVSSPGVSVVVKNSSGQTLEQSMVAYRDGTASRPLGGEPESFPSLASLLAELEVLNAPSISRPLQQFRAIERSRELPEFRAKRRNSYDDYALAYARPRTEVPPSSIATSGSLAKPAVSTDFIEGTGDPERSVHIVSGPGRRTFDELDALRIGHKLSGKAGSISVCRRQKAQSAHSVVEGLVDSIAADARAKPLVIVQAHGEDRKGVHCMNLDGQYAPTRHLFERISLVTDRAVDVLLTACEGGYALEECGTLPSGSRVVTLVPGKQDVPGMQVDRLFLLLESTPQAQLNARTILLASCLAMGTRTPPSLAQSTGGGQKITHLQPLLERRLGKSFSSAQRQQAHKDLDALADADRVNAVMEKMSSVSTPKQLNQQELRIALAIVAALHISDDELLVSAVPLRKDEDRPH